MKKINPKIIRIGDTVKIVKPNIFIRCGYPLSKNEAKKEICRLPMIKIMGLHSDV